MKKRIVPGLLCLAMTTVFMGGCSNNGGAPANTKEEGENTKTVKISVGNWPKENQVAYRESYQKYLEDMKRKYPYIVIEPDEWSYDVNSFLPKAASGELPTIYNTHFTEPGKIIEAGYAADVTEALKKYGYDKAANPKLLDIAMKDGKMYGIPENAYTFGLIYNNNLLKQAGEVDENGIPKYPQTYEEMAQLAKRIKDKTGKTGFFLCTTQNYGGWQFMNIAWSYGTKFEQKVDGKWKATFNSPEGVAALQFVKDLKWKYDVLPKNALVSESEFLQLFATDQVAMGFCAPDKINAFIDNYKMDKNNISMSKLPAGPAGRYVLSGGTMDMFSSRASAEEIDACMKWLDVRGPTPKVTDELKESWERYYKTESDKGHAVGPGGISIWVNPERVAAEFDIRKKYINVNMDLFKDYMTDSKDVMINAEEPVCTQELYKLFDIMIQTVLTDKNVDCKDLLDKAASNFQKNYLDKLNQ